MNTKQKIISRAITLYNDQGFSHVTSRNLAKSLGMSHGNLEYHYPNKEAILMAIYRKMRHEIAEVYGPTDESGDSVIHFNELLVRLEAFRKKYSFFNLDVLEISRSFPQVDALLKATFRIRRKQMAYFYGRFLAQGYLAQETVPGQYLRLQHTIRIVITFWSSQQVVFPKFADAEEGDLATYVWALILPYFTEKGKEAYRTLAYNPVSL